MLENLTPAPPLIRFAWKTFFELLGTGDKEKHIEWIVSQLKWPGSGGNHRRKGIKKLLMNADDAMLEAIFRLVVYKQDWAGTPKFYEAIQKRLSDGKGREPSEQMQLAVVDLTGGFNNWLHGTAIDVLNKETVDPLQVKIAEAAE